MVTIMQICSDNVTNGVLSDEFGHRGTQFLNGKKPNRSFHIEWKDVPDGTKSLALIFLDHDAIPVCGFSWIHWTVANIDPSIKSLPENASIDLNLPQGVTSWYSGIIPEDFKLTREDATGYGGCAPPDKPHVYTLTMYALDTMLDLPHGFYANELNKAMEGHILETATLNMEYSTK